MWTADHPGQRFESWLRRHPQLSTPPGKLFSQSHAICFLGQEEANLNYYLGYSLPLALCHHPTDEPIPGPCGRCPGCIGLKLGFSEDFCQLMPIADQIYLPQTRQFVQSMIETRVQRLRVGLILYPECLRVEAANYLLKFMEEPPPNRVLLLYSRMRGPILPTIRSRLVMMHLPSGASEFSDGELELARSIEFNLAYSEDGNMSSVQGWEEFWQPVRERLLTLEKDLQSDDALTGLMAMGSRLHQGLRVFPGICPKMALKRRTLIRAWLSAMGAGNLMTAHHMIAQLKQSLESMAEQASQILRQFAELNKEKFGMTISHPALGDFKESAHSYCRGFVYENADHFLRGLMQLAFEDLQRPDGMAVCPPWLRSAGAQLRFQAKVAEARQMVYNHFPLDTAFAVLSSFMMYEHEQ